MKFTLVLSVCLLVGLFAGAQELPKDVEQVYKAAEKYKSKGELTQAVNSYKEVLRSVAHIQSMVSIGDIEMNMRKPPNYRVAYEYYDMAITTLENAKVEAEKKKQKDYLAKQIEPLVPKRNKAKSFVDDFDKAKELKQDGNRLMEDEDLD